MAAEARGRRVSDVDLASRKAREASLRRSEVIEWLRKMVGGVLGKELPAEPSEQDFRHSLRSGIILCTALNKVQEGSVPKIIEPPSDTAIAHSGYLLPAYQYFENIRNFLDSVERLGIPAFEASDLEQGGKSSGIVNCILMLKSYYERKQRGLTDLWKYSGNLKSPCSDKKPNAMDMLDNVMEVFQDAKAVSNEQAIIVSKDAVVSSSNKAGETEATSMKHERQSEKTIYHVHSRGFCLKYQDFIGHQQRYIQDLKKKLHSTKEELQIMQMEYQKEIENLGKHLNGLAQAASGYQKVLEENRKLYNQVQDLKGNIRVYCRVRPFLPGQPNHLSTVDNSDKTIITILNPSRTGKVKTSFTFNRVFGPTASQEEVFADTQPLIRSVLDGYNVCIFAYGQTGSGKTFTMTGPRELTAETLGVNYRALNDLFLISEQRRGTISYDISVQMIEIYNEQVRDLLSTDDHNKRLEICTNSSNGINVPNANLIPVSSASDVIHLMNLGHKNRSVGSTLMNERSSRSHSCLMVHVQGRDLTSGAILGGCMHLVDLAGSERINKTGAAGDRLKEAQHINRSLSALGNVIHSLAQKQSHVPYRNSKLTQLLQDSLGGQAKTLMFVHISPEPDALGETISTLKFAERVSTVKLGVAQVNKEAADGKELKQQIAAQAALTHKRGVDAASLSLWNDTGNSCRTEEMNVSSLVSRRLTVDPQEVLTNTPPEPSLSTTRDSIKGESIDHKHVRDPSKVWLEPALNNVMPSRRWAQSVDHLDEVYGVTSDPSEEDQQGSIHTSGSTMNSVVEKAKRASRKAGGRSRISQPARRLSNRMPWPSG